MERPPGDHDSARTSESKPELIARFNVPGVGDVTVHRALVVAQGEVHNVSALDKVGFFTIYKKVGEEGEGFYTYSGEFIDADLGSAVKKAFAMPR